MVLTACVAGLHIEMTCHDEAFFTRRLSEYLCEPVESPDLKLCTEICDTIDEPEGEFIGSYESQYAVRTADGLCRYMKGNPNKGIPLAVRYEKDYRSAVIQIRKDFIVGEVGLTDWEYIHTGWAFRNRLSVLGGMVLHGSAICCHGKGIIFSADSGTGKSTHVSLWKKRFGDDVQIINDDKPALRFAAGECRIYGTPWSGKTDLNQNINCPLSAIVLLERSAHNEIRRLEMAEAVAQLLIQMPHPFYDASVTEQTLDFLQKIYEAHIPIYRLKCNVSDEAVDVAKREIMK